MRISHYYQAAVFRLTSFDNVLYEYEKQISPNPIPPNIFNLR